MTRPKTNKNRYRDV